MTALILDGKHLATLNQISLKKTIEINNSKGFKTPALAVILVGDDLASRIYVEKKHAACLDVGIQSHVYKLSNQITESKLLTLITQLNNDPLIDGILVQLPLPNAIRTHVIMEHIKPSKDVDGLHPYNLGRLAQGKPILRPCTPFGIIQLLNHYQLSLRGKHAVVLGASMIVGRPMALELLMAEATVTICHRRTVCIQQHIQMADILISATGDKQLVKPEWLQAHQIVIDVGIHRLDDGRVHGDINFDLAKHIVSAITPVPGGVGPMTISTLLMNTLFAATLNE